MVFQICNTVTPLTEVVLQTQAKVLLQKLYPKESYEKIIAKLVSQDQVLLRYLRENVPALKDEMGKPTLEVLLAYKDRFRIPDNEWYITVDVFRLGEYATIHHLRHVRGDMDGNLPVVISPGKCGTQVDILKYLEWYLEKLDPMPANNKLIDLKFVFDGGRMTS